MAKRLKATAYHEAGHAVAGAVLLDIYSPVYIDGREGKYHGSMIQVSNSDQYTRWDCCVLAMAGPYAEARISKVSKYFTVMYGGMSDYEGTKEIINSLIEYGFAVSIEAAWRRVEDETRFFLRSHWLTIEAVAEKLLTHGELSAEDLKQVINDRADRPS